MTRVNLFVFFLTLAAFAGSSSANQVNRMVLYKSLSLVCKGLAEHFRNLSSDPAVAKSLKALDIVAKRESRSAAQTAYFSYGHDASWDFVNLIVNNRTYKIVGGLNLSEKFYIERFGKSIGEFSVSKEMEYKTYACSALEIARDELLNGLNNILVDALVTSDEQ